MIYLLLLDNKCITRKSRVKFQGVFLDENLTWKPHISHVCKKISKSIGIIYRARFYQWRIQGKSK